MSKKRYVIVGTGSRGVGMFARPIVRDYPDVAQLVGLCDTNRTRLDRARDQIGIDVPTFLDFDQMMDTVDCDAVIVTTPDATHHHFIIKAFERGKDTITEKPMTTDDAKCRAILDAEKRCGRTLTVTFNYRYAPYETKVKEIIASGAIGQVLSVDFQWFLDTVHGADYFRRWHRQKAMSGGLLVHKATHHFDLVNWWVDDEPKSVFATGERRFYGPVTEQRGERCLTCSYQSTCPFFLDLRENKGLAALYLEAEGEDGYWRDQCVFSPDIDIEDTIAAIVKYKSGIQLSYSLHAYMPFEGYRIAFNGTKGRLEAGQITRAYPSEEKTLLLRDRSGVRSDVYNYAWGNAYSGADKIRVFSTFGGLQEFDVPHVRGGHGGGDTRLRDMLFRPNQPDPYGHAAGSRAGAMSILVGVAANHSIKRHGPVTISELLDEEPAHGEAS